MTPLARLQSAIRSLEAVGDIGYVQTALAELRSLASELEGPIAPPETFAATIREAIRGAWEDYDANNAEPRRAEVADPILKPLVATIRSEARREALEALREIVDRGMRDRRLASEQTAVLEPTRTTLVEQAAGLEMVLDMIDSLSSVPPKPLVVEELRRWASNEIAAIEQHVVEAVANDLDLEVEDAKMELLRRLQRKLTKLSPPERAAEKRDG